jgi:DNA repair protein RadC
MKRVIIKEEIFQVAEVELIYKSKGKPSDRPKITSSKDAFDILIQTWDNNRIDLVEQFKVIFLNPSKAVTGIYELSSGDLQSTVVDIRLVFAAALKAAATSIVLAHNHPTGSLNPSEADQKTTKRIVAGGKLLSIHLLDHLIISRDGYLSMADEGLL